MPLPHRALGAWAADVVTACVKIFVTLTGSPVPDGIQLTPGPLVSELRRVQSRAVIEPVNRSILRHDEAKNLLPTRVRAKVEGTHGRRLAYFARRRRHLYAAKVGLQYCVAPGSRVACKLLNLKDKFWRREWDSNPR